jgi:DoxX-like protein
MQSTTTVWIGRVISAVCEIFLLFDAVIHVLVLPAVRQAFDQLGYPQRYARGIGIIELVCLVLYVIPQTAVLGAVLLTAYLGGAAATQLRAGADPFTLLFPVGLGVLVWVGLYLRDARLRGLVSLQH